MENLPLPPPLHMPQIAAVPTVGNNHSLLFALYYVFKILPILMAGISIYLGYRLFILGVTGQASLSVESKTIQGQLINAAPGLFFRRGRDRSPHRGGLEGRPDQVRRPGND
jgi:hypothetical protein